MSLGAGGEGVIFSPWQFHSVPGPRGYRRQGRELQQTLVIVFLIWSFAPLFSSSSSFNVFISSTPPPPTHTHTDTDIHTDKAAPCTPAPPTPRTNIITSMSHPSTFSPDDTLNGVKLHLAPCATLLELASVRACARLCSCLCCACVRQPVCV